MSRLSVDEGKLKDLLKTAILELLEERKDLVRDLLEEALEDIVLVRAIEAGEQTGTVSRDEVFKVMVFAGTSAVWRQFGALRRRRGDTG